MSAKAKFITIISALVVGSLVLCIVAICQFININNAKNHLNFLLAQSQTISAEVDEMKKTLETIESQNYKEDQARKNGYGYAHEKRFIEN